nr:MFS transporter [Bacillus sp. 165]
MIINVTASSFLWPFNTIYIHDHLGKSLSLAGFALMVNSLAGVVGNLWGGVLFDKLGGYKSILIGILVTLSALIGFVFLHDWPTYVVWLGFVGLGSGMVFPAMYAMVGAVWPEGGRRAFNAMYVAQNVGVAVGTALGGLVASYRIDYIFLANLTLYFIFFLIALLGFKSMQVKVENKKKVQTKEKIQLTGPFGALITVCIAYAMCWFVYVQWQGPLASHMQDLDVSLKQYSLLWTINGALIVVAQPVVTGVIQVLKRSIKQQMIIGIFIFIVSYIITTMAEGFTMFVTAMVVLTIGEMFVWPAIPTIANSLAPPDKVGFYQGVVNSAATFGRMFAPVIGGALVDYFNINVLFMFVFAMLVVATIITSLYDRKLKVEEPVEQKIAV